MELSRVLPPRIWGWLLRYPRLLSAAFSRSPLARARWLTAPLPVAMRRGDVEHMEWWERHRGTLDEAWCEFGRGEERAYRLPSAGSGLHPACPLLGGGGATICEQPAPGVYAFPLFTADFCSVLLGELDRLAAAGIPVRRPNGMNRYGLILSDLGFGDLLRALSNQLVAPLALELFPEWVGVRDCEEQYGFSVDYSCHGGDRGLAEHSDTSNVTLNVCLGRQFTGGELAFKGVRFTASADRTEKDLVAHRPGWALLHLGGHIHSATALASGERSNLIRTPLPAS